MKTKNAYKMIEKAGSKITNDPQYFNGLVARFGYYNIELTNQDGEIIAVKVVPAHEKVESVSDYYPGTYFKSLTAAIEYVLARRIDGNPRYSTETPPPEPAQDPESYPGYSLEYDRDWTWVTFPTKPAPEVLTSLKSAGARWSHKKSGWYFTRRMEEAELAPVLGSSSPEPEPAPVQARPSRYALMFED